VLLEGVLLEVALRSKGVCAECACVGQHAVLAHLVRAQLAGLDELPVAQLACVRLLTGVGARVSLEEFRRVRMREAVRASGAPSRGGAPGCRAWSAAYRTRGIGSAAARPGAAPSRGTPGKPETKFDKI
jgi:hypothetical protein